MRGTDLSFAATLLMEGQLVAIPTETVYGLAANALNEEAVARIFSAKNRPSFDPLIVHAAHAEAAFALASDVPETARLLARAFWPGPLTMIFEKNKSLVKIFCVIYSISSQLRQILLTQVNFLKIFFRLKFT